MISLKFVSKSPTNNICSDNGLVPARRQAIIWTNDCMFPDAYMRHLTSVGNYFFTEKKDLLQSFPVEDKDLLILHS